MKRQWSVSKGLLSSTSRPKGWFVFQLKGPQRKREFGESRFFFFCRQLSLQVFPARDLYRVTVCFVFLRAPVSVDVHEVIGGSTWHQALGQNRQTDHKTIIRHLLEPDQYIGCLVLLVNLDLSQIYYGLQITVTIYHYRQLLLLNWKKSCLHQKEFFITTCEGQFPNKYVYIGPKY